MYKKILKTRAKDVDISLINQSVVSIQKIYNYTLSDRKSDCTVCTETKCV